jgi:hypothetical protein
MSDERRSGVVDWLVTGSVFASIDSTVTRAVRMSRYISSDPPDQMTSNFNVLPSHADPSASATPPPPAVVANRLTMGILPILGANYGNMSS